MKISPYGDQPHTEWSETTQKLIADHPLTTEEMREAVTSSWKALWSTEVGEGIAKIPLKELAPPATVIGYFFEKILAKELSEKHKNQWKGGVGSEKDLHYVDDPKYSIEVKSSGQLGMKIYGNRSYGQEIENKDRAKKDKSGYYLTVNFHEDKLNLVRFGWIDGKDWVPQKSQTGQMAGLSSEVYDGKLIPIQGEYTLGAPLLILNGVGKNVADQCSELGINSVNDALQNKDKLNGKLKKVYDNAIAYRDKYAVRKDGN